MYRPKIVFSTKLSILSLVFSLFWIHFHVFIVRFLSVQAGTHLGLGLGRFCWFLFKISYHVCPHIGIPDLQRLREVNSGCQACWKWTERLQILALSQGQANPQTSGEIVKNGAKCNVAFSHHNCIYKATRPPARVLELLLSWLKQ